jgi:sorbitol-specific phosphotransferase system component IIC
VPVPRVIRVLLTTAAPPSSRYSYVPVLGVLFESSWSAYAAGCIYYCILGPFLTDD